MTAERKQQPREARLGSPGGATAEAPGETNELVHDVTSGGVRLRITEWIHPGTERDPVPLVALPGVLSPRASFRALAAAMGPSFRFIAVDLPGLGESERPSPTKYAYTIENMAEGIADLFGGLGLARAHVLGHGVGGAIALHLAAGHPELVARLCLIAPMAEGGAGTGFSGALLAPVVGGLVFRQLIGRSLFRRIYRSRVNPGAPPADLDSYYDVLTQPAARAALLAILRNFQDTRSVIADSRRVRSQCLLVWGMQDQVFPVSHGRKLAREMPEAGLELLELGHAPHEQAPETIGPILSRFFEGRRAGFQ
jgi:pimeloyl-ACP methyl ester carboxylesterase